MPALPQHRPGSATSRSSRPGIARSSAGIYNVTHRAASGELQRRKCDSIVASGAEVVVTGNPGCLLQIRAGLPDEVKVEHIVDLLWEAYASSSPLRAAEALGEGRLD